MVSDAEALWLIENDRICTVYLCIGMIAAAPGWLALMYDPSWEYTDTLVCLGTGVNCVIYFLTLGLEVLFGRSVKKPADPDRAREKKNESLFRSKNGGFFSLRGVMTVFRTGSVRAMIGAWVHYFAFDIVVGRMMALDAEEVGISKLIVAPLLVITVAVGPLGPLLYVMIRVATTTFA